METKEEIKQSLIRQAADLLKRRLSDFGIVANVQIKVKDKG